MAERSARSAIDRAAAADRVAARLGLVAPGEVPRFAAARRRRVLGHPARRGGRPPLLHQARAAEAQGGGAVGGAGRAQRRRSGLAQDGRRNGCRTTFRGCWARIRRRACLPWSTCRRSAIRSGRTSCATARSTPDFAAEVGARLAAIHRHSASRTDLAAQFANDATFEPIRIEPYLRATALRAIRTLADRLEQLAATTLATRLALVHGDISPKNILRGPHGPVFLDAECAWYGDPAFDLAFCLNHLLLKGSWQPQWKARYLACFERLVAGLPGGEWTGSRPRRSSALRGTAAGPVAGPRSTASRRSNT